MIIRNIGFAATLACVLCNPAIAQAYADMMRGVLMPLKRRAEAATP